MTDIRRTILWVIFGFSMVLLWDQWQVFNGKQATFFPTHKPAVVAAAPTATVAPGAATTTSSAAAPGGTVPGAAAVVPGQPAAPAAIAHERVAINTDLFSATIDTDGASLTNLALLKYADLKDPNQRVMLFENDSPATRYVAQTGILYQGESGGLSYPNHTTPMAPKLGPRSMANGQDTLEVGFESQPVNGIKYVKTYVFHRGNYAIGVRHEVVNTGDQPRSLQLYMELRRHGTEAAGSMFGTNTYNGPAAYTNEKHFQKIAFSDIAKAKAEVPPPAADGWVAMVQHYFVSAWLLNGESSALNRTFTVQGPDKLGDNLYSLAMVAKLPPLAPGATQVVNSTLTVALPWFTTATSGLPSPFRSAAATEEGFMPVG